MSFIATANAVVHAGATPVFAEINPETFNLDPDDTATRIGPRTKAIMLVHQLGLPADLEAFTALAAAHDLILVEDAACALGSSYRTERIGTHSEYACFSFHPRKLITTGDGGMILTSSEATADALRRLRHHGMSVPDTVRHSSPKVIRESYPTIGFNARLTDIQAAVGIEQMRRLPDILARRRHLADLYDRALAGHPVIATPVVPDGVEWNVQTYTVRLKDFDAARRDLVMQSMLDQGIATRPGVMTAHREPAYVHLGVSLPVSETASDASLALPLFPAMTVEELEETVASIRRAVEII
jgi:dTDP-4-amino-4,6-dideoxygalactose transaminase